MVLLGMLQRWMLNYTGLMDEFRVYNIVTENEVLFYKLEKIIDKIRRASLKS
jgi:hypothetical protein